jgi:hypothetical protein
VKVFYVQTTFDLEDYNTFEAALSEAESWRVNAPVAQDAPGEPTPDDPDPLPRTMRAYRTGGTPWTVVVDRGGLVRYNGPTPSFAFQRALVDELLKE